MPLTKLMLKPGVNREGTIYSNSGGWYDGDKIRFRSGLPEKIGGWTQVSPFQFIGICRSLWVWSSATTGVSNTYIGLGTNAKYYIYYGGAYNDITPFLISPNTNLTTNTLTSNPFSAVSGSPTVTVNDTVTGITPNVGDYVVLTSTTTVGGLTISGQYIVTAVPSNTSFKIKASSNASSTGTGGGTVTIQYYYQSGLSIYTVGSGWGAGPWGGTTGSSTVSLTNPFTTTSSSYVVTVTQAAHGLSTGNSIFISSVANSVGGIPAKVLQQGFGVTVTGTNTYTINVSSAWTGSVSAATNVGGAVTIVLPYTTSTSTPAATGWGSAAAVGIGQQLRLWTNDNFGSDLVLAPRGGPIFYWQNSLGLSTSSKYLSTLANTSTLLTDSTTFSSGSSTINITSANAPYVYPYSYISGTGIPSNTYVTAVNNVTGVATISASTTSASSGSYSFSYSGAFVPNSTYQVLSSDVQEFIIAFGANPYTPGTPSTSFNPLLVRWSDQANAYQWIPQITNQSGEFALGNGSYIVGARSTRQEILVWTDSAIYSMQYIGAPYVWGFQLLMDNISIIGPNAMITVNNVTYWMGRDRFYMYNGTVQTLPCTIKQYIFEDINQNQAFQIFTGSNEGFNEVWWFYVSNSSGGTQVDKYAIYNYLDNIWYYGSMARTAWYQTGITQFPVAADYNSRLLYHENGNDDVSTGTPTAIDSYIQSSDIEVSPQDAGQHFGFVWRMFPDINFNSSTSNNPSVTIQLIPRNSSGSAYGSAANPAVTSLQDYTNIPAYTVQQFTGEVYTRLRGRQMAFRLESNGQIGVAWQLGTPRFDVRPDGRR